MAKKYAELEQEKMKPTLKAKSLEREQPDSAAIKEEKYFFYFFMLGPFVEEKVPEENQDEKLKASKTEREQLQLGVWDEEYKRVSRALLD